MAIQIGDKAPEILGTDQNGKEIRLSDFKGRKLALYFYPKDNTSGCTAEACSLRDGYEELRAAGYEVVGVSRDSAKSHQGFIAKHELPFDLIADTGTELQQHEVLNVAKGVSVYEIDGPFFFGVATRFDELMRTALAEKPLVRIIRMRKVSFIDATALHNLEMLIKSSQNDGIHIVLSGVKSGVRSSLEHAGIDKLIGSDHICDHITKAVMMANLLAAEIRSRNRR